MCTATAATEPVTSTVKVECPKCGTSSSGKRSCCSRGGSWVDKCGNEVNAKFEHTWGEGIRVCSSSAVLNTGHLEPDGSQETQAKETSTEGTVHGEADAGIKHYANSQVHTELAHPIAYATVVLVALFV